MPCVTGKKYWKSRYKKERISRMCTVSQEALALWILHNYEKKWSVGDSENKVQALYTGITKGNKMFSGWDDEGIQKYNEFCTFVKQNREAGSDFEYDIQMKMIEDYKQEKISAQRENAPLPVACFDDLDEKLQELPRTVQNSMPPQPTILECNSALSEVASTISSSSGSTSYRSAAYYGVGEENDEIVVPI